MASAQTLTDRFAAACTRLTWDAVPPATRNRAKLILLDTLGAMLSASRPIFPGTQKLAEFVRAEREDGPCLVVGTDIHTSLTNAALMNGYLGYAMDIESHHGPAVLHAAASNVPAALAVGQVAASDGAAFLAAMGTGIEVSVRVSLSIGPNDMYARGIHPTAISNAFGTAAAAGLLLKLDPRQQENAFGLAANLAGGLLAWASDFSEESRPFNPALASRNGVTAAWLASLGFGGPQGVFDRESKYNVYRAWSTDQLGQPERLLDGFGERFAVDELIIKLHASCAFTHPGADGVLEIMRAEKLAAGDLAGITIRFPRSGAHMIDNNPLRSHNAQYVLPVAAVRGRVGFEDVIFDRSSEPAIKRLMEATEFVHDDGLDPLYPETYTTIVQLRTRDGTVHERKVVYARGCQENPVSDEEIVQKYRHLAGQRVDSAQVDRVLAAVMGLDKAANLDELVAALTVR